MACFRLSKRITATLFVYSQVHSKLADMADNGKADDMNTAGEIIRNRMSELDLTTREVDRLTEDAGNRVAYSTIARIAKGTYQPSRNQLNALAKALKVRPQLLLEAAGVEDVGDPFVLPDYANKLNINERDAVRNIIRLLADNKKGSHNEDATFTSPATGYLARASRGQFEVIDVDAETDAIAARNRREGDPDLDEDVPLDDA